MAKKAKMEEQAGQPKAAGSIEDKPTATPQTTAGNQNEANEKPEQVDTRISDPEPTHKAAWARFGGPAARCPCADCMIGIPLRLWLGLISTSLSSYLTRGVVVKS